MLQGHRATTKSWKKWIWVTGVIADGSFTLRKYELSHYFATVSLNLDSMTFIYELDPYPAQKENVGSSIELHLVRQGTDQVK